MGGTTPNPCTTIAPSGSRFSSEVEGQSARKAEAPRTPFPRASPYRQPARREIAGASWSRFHCLRHLGLATEEPSTMAVSRAVLSAASAHLAPRTKAPAGPQGRTGGESVGRQPRDRTRKARNSRAAHAAGHRAAHRWFCQGLPRTRSAFSHKMTKGMQKQSNPANHPHY